MCIKTFSANLTKSLIIIAITLSPTITFANTKTILNPITIPVAPTLSSKAYLLIDHNSDRILAEKNIHEKVEPASLTKIMTMYVVDNEIKNNNLSLDEEILISKNAWKTQGSRMFLEAGKKILVKELIKGVIIQSGNDASIALAEHIAGSEATFADLMNGYAKMLGMNNTNFVNATGLPDDNHYTTAYDLALLTKAIIKDFPETYNIYSQKSFTFNGIEQLNRNKLLWRNHSVDGVKTGHTDNAGYCLVASGKHADTRLTSIILGSTTEDVRINEANKLLVWGFRFFETHLIYNSAQTLQNIKVWMGKTKQLALGLSQDLHITIPHGQFKKLNIIMNIPKCVKAPLKKGTQIGFYEITLQDQIIAKQPIIALNGVKMGGFLSKLKDTTLLSLQSLWEKFIE